MHELRTARSTASPRSTASARSARRGQQGGFTLIELLVAMLVMIIGLIGVVMIAMSITQSAGYSKRFTEASVLGEDKMEWLRGRPLTAATAGGNEQVDGLGYLAADGMYNRTWQGVVQADNSIAVTVTVSWIEDGDPKAITLRTIR